MEPEDLTNSILVFLLSVFISTLTICVPVLPFHTTDISAISNGTLLSVILNGGLVTHFVKANPYILPLRAKECAGEHCCLPATHLGMSTCRSTLSGVFVAEWEEPFLASTLFLKTTGMR